MSPVLAFVAGAVVVGAPLALWLWRGRLTADARIRRLSVIDQMQREILAAAPDGLFMWDHTSGKQFCSRRLAVLLNLPGGTNSDFGDVAARFEGADAEALEKAAGELRRKGTGFEMLLEVSGGQRKVHVVGVLAAFENGSPLADLLWMRDADTAPGPGSGAASSPVHGPGPFKSLLDVLPFPVWLRGPGLDVEVANNACSSGLIAAARKLAERVLVEGGAASERHLLNVGDAPRLFEINEISLEGWEGTAGFAIDRTATEKMEGEFARHDAARDQVLESLETAIAIFDDGARLKFFNSAYCRIWGLDEGWLSGEPGLGDILERLRELRRLPEVANFRAFKEGQLALFAAPGDAVETLLHLPDGSTLRSVVGPHSLGGRVFSYEDVTKRLALERSYNTLIAVQSETLDHLYEGVAVFGSDGRLKLCNPTFATLWKLDAEDLKADLHLAQFVEAMRPYLGGENWAAHKERVIGRVMSRESRSGRLARKDGSVLDYANVPLPDGAVLLSYLDVSDSARVEQALRQRADALQDADRLKSEFISNVSFELRTPLNTLIGFAEILNQEYFGELNPRQREYSSGILESSTGLMTVIGDILDLATIEAGKMSLELDTVELHTMLVSVLGLIHERARHKNLKLEFACPGDIGWIVADEKRLKQVLFNLLSNAVTFTPEHGSVGLEASRSGGEVTLKVSDSGIGIPKADRERVFQSFEHGSTAQTGQGPGLGLSLVKRFIELHGGSVQLTSSPSKGTTVTCHLPAAGLQGEKD